MSRTIKISDVADLNSATISKSNVPRVINYLDTGNLTKNIFHGFKRIRTDSEKLPSRAQRIVKDGTLVYSTVRPALEHFGFIKKPIDNLIVSTGFTTIDVHDQGIDPKFLYYLLTQSYVTKYLHRIASSSVSSYPSINPTDIGNLRFKVPNDVSVQRNIANALTVLDKKIEQNHTINAQLESMAKTLYDYWFLQFDFPDATGRPYKHSGGKMVYSEKLNRNIPEGWNVFSVADLVTKSKNGDWGADLRTGQIDQEVYCIRGADINALNGSGILDPPIRYILPSHSDRLLTADDLVVEISGGSPEQSTGRMAHISNEVLKRFKVPLVCSNFCKAISLKNKKLSFIIEHHWNHLYESGVFFNFEGKTSGIKNLLFDQLTKDVYIALPNNENLINKFYEISMVLDRTMQNNLAQNKELTHLRDWLIPILMNGRAKILNKELN